MITHPELGMSETHVEISGDEIRAREVAQAAEMRRTHFLDSRKELSQEERLEWLERAIYNIGDEQIWTRGVLTRVRDDVAEIKRLHTDHRREVDERDARQDERITKAVLAANKKVARRLNVKEIALLVGALMGGSGGVASIVYAANGHAPPAAAAPTPAPSAPSK